MAQPDRPEMDDKPPVLGSWRNLYAMEITVLIVLIAVFAWIAQCYS